MTDSWYGVGTWEASAVGVTLNNNIFDTIAKIQKLSNGTFTSDISVSLGGSDNVLVHATGKYCK